MNRYSVYTTPEALHEIKRLPGNIRQRIKHAIDELAENPRPHNSKELELPEDLASEAELCRLRLDHWRIVYTITEIDLVIDVLAIRKRPPYDYGDLLDLLSAV